MGHGTHRISISHQKESFRYWFTNREGLGLDLDKKTLFENFYIKIFNWKRKESNSNFQLRCAYQTTTNIALLWRMVRIVFLFPTRKKLSKFRGSLAWNARFGCSFWKLLLWNLEEASCEMLVLEASFVIFGGGLAGKVRFGSFWCFSLCFLCVFCLCLFSLFSLCFLCVFCLCFLSVFSVCVFSLCFLSVFSVCVFSLCFLFVFSVCFLCVFCLFSLCVFSLCVLSVFSLCVFSLCLSLSLSVFSVCVSYQASPFTALPKTIHI